MLYPQIWGGKNGDFSTTGAKSSTAGAATVASNGNCGWGVSGNWIDPGTTACVGYYAYNDASADQGTLIVEGIYWAIVTYIGGLYTTSIAAIINNEWLMAVPDDGMVSPSSSSSPSPCPCPRPNPKPNPNPTVTQILTLTRLFCRRGRRTPKPCSRGRRAITTLSRTRRAWATNGSHRSSLTASTPSPRPPRRPPRRSPRQLPRQPPRRPPRPPPR